MKVKAKQQKNSFSKNLENYAGEERKREKRKKL